MPWRPVHIALLTALAAAAAPPAAPPLPEGFPGGVDPLVAERISLFHEEAAVAPAFGDRWIDLGNVYEANGYPDLAEQCYEAAAALDGASARAWFHLAGTRAALGRADAAIEAMRRAVDGYGPARWRLGLLLLDAGRVDEAGLAFREAAERDPADPMAWMGLARVHLLQGRAAEAASIITLRLAHGPYAPYARHLLASAYRQLGRPDDALAELARPTSSAAPWRDEWTDRMLAQRTGLEPCRTTVATLIATGRYSEAVTWTTALLRYWPDDLDLRNRLATAEAGSGYPDRAVALLAEVLDGHPDHVPTLVNAATILLDNADGSPADLDAALEHLRHALRIDPHHAEARMLEGHIHLSRGDYEAAVESYRAAYRDDPRRERLLVEIGRCLVALERWEEAAESFERALARNPQRGQAYLGLGIARLGQGRLDEAAAALAGARRNMNPRGAAWPLLQQQVARLERLRAGAGQGAAP